MAKKISDEVIKLSIVIDGNPAQKEILDLEKSTIGLKQALKEQLAEKKKLERQRKTDTEEYKTLTAAIAKNTREIEANEAKIKELTGALKLTEMSMAQLRHKADLLTRTLAHLVPGTDNYERYRRELEAVTGQINELRGRGQQAGFSIGRMADSFNRYAALGASIIATGTGVVLSLQKIIDYNGKLSDAQTNVQKTTGLTRYEVDELTKSFGLLKTRTGRIELLGIAEVGGRLGIAKEEIQEFVKVMDKSAVALGDSFEGGPDVVAEKLGRIKGLYEELRNSDVGSAFESVGSALNDLGAAGTASEANLAEFATRVGALPEAFKPSIKEALGLGAAFEESGLKAEIAATNYGKVITIAARDTAAFATVLKRPQAELEKLIDTDPTEFFFQFAEALDGLKPTQLAKVLDYLKLNDNEVKMVLGAASQNVDLFREKIDLAGDSMADATSLTNEYDLKNNNLAATLERLKKTVVGWFSSDTVVAWLTACVNGFAKFIGAVEDTEGTMESFRNKLVFVVKILAVILASYISYNAAVRLCSVFTRTLAAAQTLLNIVNSKGKLLTDLLRGSVLLMSAGYNVATGNITRANAAMKLFNTTVRFNPLGILITALVAVGTAYFAFRKNTDEAAKSQKKLNAAMEVDLERTKELSKSKANLQSKVAPLIKILNDENASLELRRKAYEKLIEINPDFIGTIDSEYMATNKLAEAYDNLLKKLDQKALANARERVRQSRADAVGNAEAEEFDAKIKADKEAEENKKRREKYEAEVRESMRKMSGNFTDFSAVERTPEIYKEKEAYEAAKQKAIDARKALADYGNYQEETVKKLMEELKKHKADSIRAKEIQAEIDAILGFHDNTPSAKTKDGVFIPGDKDDKAEKARLKALKDMLDLRKHAQDEAKKYQDEANNLERKAIDDRLALMQDGFDKEEALESEHSRRKIEDLKKQLVDESEILQLDAKINDPKADKQTKAAWMHTKESWVEKNKHLNALIEIEEGRHEIAMGTIDQHRETKRLQDLETSFEQQAMARQAAHNYELIALGDNQVAKDKLQDEFNKKELDHQMQHLNNLIQEKQKILDDQNTSIDFDLLTPEQQEAVKQQIEDLKLKISELLLAKQGLTAKGGTDDVNAAMQQAFGDADVLGFTADQWGNTFASLDTLSEKLMATKMVVSALQNAWAQYGQYVEANETAQVKKYERNADAKKRRLDWQLQSGKISQGKYNREVEMMDAELDRKKADIEYKQAKRQKLMAVSNIIMSTAQAILGIWAQVPKFDFGVTAGILTGVVGALGAVQLATVAKTPLPAKGYEEGLYPEYVKREQDGKVFKSTYGGKTKSGLVNKPTYFLTGENGPEMIIDSRAYRELSPETRDALVRELRGIKGFENGMYRNNLSGARYEVPAEPAPASGGRDLEVQMMVAAALNRNSDIIERALNEGFVSYYSRDYRDLNKMQQDLDKVKISKEKARQ